MLFRSERSQELGKAPGSKSVAFVFGPAHLLDVTKPTHQFGYCRVGSSDGQTLSGPETVLVGHFLDTLAASSTREAPKTPSELVRPLGPAHKANRTLRLHRSGLPQS